MLVVTVLDLNALGFERHVEYEDVGGDCLGLERSCIERHVEYEDVGGDGLGL